MIPQEILSQHAPQEWIDSAFEILLAHALFGDLPHFSERYPSSSPGGFRIIQPLDYGYPFDQGPIRPVNMQTFFLTLTQIHNINVIITLSARDGFHETASYLNRWLMTDDSWSKVSEYYLVLQNNQEQRLHSVNSNGFRYIRESGDYYDQRRYEQNLENIEARRDREESRRNEIAARQEAAERLYRRVGEVFNREAAEAFGCALANITISGGGERIVLPLNYSKDQKAPDNCCRSCGRKVPLTAGLCEECQKLESLMNDCFDTNVSLSNHVGQTYEEGIIGGVD